MPEPEPTPITVPVPVPVPMPGPGPAPAPMPQPELPPAAEVVHLKVGVELQPDRARAPRRRPGAEFPDRADEWSSYLFFLREHSDIDGALPQTFDYLIEDEFAELL